MFWAQFFEHIHYTINKISNYQTKYIKSLVYYNDSTIERLPKNGLTYFLPIKFLIKLSSAYFILFIH